jgi:hypothetical protein
MVDTPPSGSPPTRIATPPRLRAAIPQLVPRHETAGAITKPSCNEEPIASDSETHSPEIAEEFSALEQFDDG